MNVLLSANMKCSCVINMMLCFIGIDVIYYSTYTYIMCVMLVFVALLKCVYDILYGSF